MRCQQELQTQGCLGVPTGKTPDDSNLAGVEAMQWVLLYLSIGHDIILSVITHKLNVFRTYVDTVACIAVAV
jgi:hypothetical protein